MAAGFQAMLASWILNALQPTVAGVIVQAILYGIFCCQVANYRQLFSDDPLKLKALVAALFVFLTATVATNIWNFELVLALAMNNPLKLAHVTDVYLCSTAFAIVTLIFGVGFFWRRTYNISGRYLKVLCTVSYILAMCGAAAFFAVVVILGVTSPIALTVNRANLWFGFANETLYATVLIAKLRRTGERGGLKGRPNPFVHVMLVTLQTSSLMALNILICAIVVTVKVQPVLAGVFYPLLPAITGISVLYTLNSRIESRQSPAVLGTDGDSIFQAASPSVRATLPSSPPQRDLEAGLGEFSSSPETDRSSFAEKGEMGFEEFLRLPPPVQEQMTVRSVISSRLGEGPSKLGRFVNGFSASVHQPPEPRRLGAAGSPPG